MTVRKKIKKKKRMVRDKYIKLRVTKPEKIFVASQGVPESTFIRRKIFGS